MNSKGKAQTPKATGITERQCPVGWIPAWDPDESGPEWWYDKSKYSQTAPVLREQVREVCSAPPPIPDDISKAALAWYAQRYRDQAPQPTDIEHCRLVSKPSAAHSLAQPLYGVGSLSPEMQTFDPGPHLRQIYVPGCLASNAAVKKTSLGPPLAIPCDYSRVRGSLPAVALTASSTHYDLTRSPGFENSSTPPDKGLAELKHSTMPLLEPSGTCSRHSNAEDQSGQGRRSSSSQYLVQPTRNGCVATPTTTMTENVKLYPTANIRQPTDTSSGRPVSVTQTMTMQRQPTTFHGPALGEQRQKRSEPLSRAPSTASSSTAATHSAHEQIPGPSDKHRNSPALESAMAPVNARQNQSHLGGIATTLRSAAAHSPKASIACGKRLRFLYEDCETSKERPTKSRRTSQNLHTISGEQPPYNSNVLGCVNSVSRLADRAQIANGPNGMDRIGQQRAPDLVQRGNVSISKADLVRNLVPGNIEVFADPRDPLVQEYIDAYTHNWLRGYRQMRARDAQTRPYHGVGVPHDRPKVPYQTQASCLRGPAFRLSQGTRSVNNAGIVEFGDTTKVVDLTRPG